MRTALVRTLRHRERQETVPMDLPARVYVLEVIAMVGDAADPESGAELRADVPTIVEALKPSPQADRLVHPAPDVKSELEQEALRHLHVEIGALVVLVYDPGSETGVDMSVKSRGARWPRAGPLLFVQSGCSGLASQSAQGPHSRPWQEPRPRARQKRLWSLAMKTGSRITLILALALAAAALMVAGCGGDDKPDYCSDVSDLQSSVDELKSVDLGTDTLSTVRTDVEAVQSDTDAVVSSAKADFPDETSAFESSVSTLSTSVKELPASPTAEQLLALAPQIASSVSAADNLKSATSSACD